jgi:hypothetical protein
MRAASSASPDRDGAAFPAWPTMADIERPDRITNITGLRTQSETPDSAGGVTTADSGRRLTVPCRLCRRPVFVLARTCRCGMTDPGRDARRPYVAPAVATLTTLSALTWWLARR